MEQKISLTVEEWVALQEQSPGGAGQIPVWFQVTGGSMLPFVRPFRDNVMLVAVKAEELKVGDIVLFPGKYLGGDYCLHRLYKIESDRVQTFGDGNMRPDHWQPKSQILGKVVLIKRGRLTIDCESPRWVRLFRLWNKLLPLRPVLLLPFRVMNKLHRLFPRIF
ncbi:MAG: S26 family signal peptidase [Prevotella sp.]|nr:S26 family signal peptidase [Prevotella sp.]MBP5776537.1 S26 family signal peptidase [Prevotella sp.]